MVVLAIPLLSMPWLLGQEEAHVPVASSRDMHEAGAVVGAGRELNVALAVAALGLAVAAAVLEVCMLVFTSLVPAAL